jgi:hypothetical protein
MKNEINAAIEKMQQKLNEILSEALELKKAINVMRKTIGQEPLYEEVVEQAKTGSGVLRADQYFGMALTTAVREVLRVFNRAVSPQDIVEQLQKGGFDFPNNWKDKKDYPRLLAIAIGKNRRDFVPVPTSEGTIYGLLDFYPEKKREKERKKNTIAQTEEPEEMQDGNVDDNAADEKDKKQKEV